MSVLQDFHGDSLHVLRVPGSHPPVSLLCLHLEEPSHPGSGQEGSLTKERRALRYQSLTLGLIFRTTRLILVAESYCQISPVPLLKPWSSITSTSTMTTTRYCQSQHSRRRLVSLLLKKKPKSRENRTYFSLVESHP